MAEIPLTALVPRATGPVATVYVLALRGGGRTAAVKVYPQPLDRRTYSGLEVEQAKLAGLRSAPSILLVDSIDELPDGRTGLRMEFCPQSLPDLVARGPLPIGDVAVLGQILASVLAQAHDIGLVHGGVTPANVLERANGQPALSDFGLSLRLRFARDLRGDAAYTAPEVLRDGELSEEADVYGLGAVLYLALTGHSPFPARTGETTDDVVLRVLREPVPDVSGRDIPPALTALLLRMMAKEPAERPDAAEVVRELEALMLRANEPAADDLDWDDFRDELAAARVAQVAPALSRAPVAQAGKLRRKRLPKGLVIAAAAAVALAAVVPVVLQPWKHSSQAQPTTTRPPVPSSISPTPAAAQAVQLELKPPKDNGTSVLLEWSSSKPLNYALYIAEQGGQAARTSYRGTGTSMTVTVTPGLKYCFEVQGTDGNAIYTSLPRSIRGATCKS
ncbi:serine/threonine-protein kinase [Kribbella alba]